MDALVQGPDQGNAADLGADGRTGWDIQAAAIQQEEEKMKVRCVKNIKFGILSDMWVTLERKKYLNIPHLSINMDIYFDGESVSDICRTGCGK